MTLHPAYPVVTERLELRPLTHDDVPALLTYRGDPEVCRYLPFDPMDRNVLEDRLSKDLGLRAITGEGQGLTLGVEAEGQLVGDVVLFFHSARHASGEIGYVFHPDVAGRGYATEACAAILDLAFDELQLNRVTARMDARNEPSARLVERLGMREEARFLRSEMGKDGWIDVLIYAMLNDEWDDPRRARARARQRGSH